MCLKLNYFLLGFIFTISVKLADLQNNVINGVLNVTYLQNGFHRTLCYHAEIDGLYSQSRILIEEIFPKDIFLDPYQLINRNDVFIQDVVDTEIPEYQAKPLAVQICTSAGQSVCISVHFRYQMPHQCEVYGKHAYINMNTPSISLQDSTKKHSTEFHGDCKDRSSYTYSTNLEVKIPILKVPVGCTEHFHYTLMLLMLTVGFCIYLFYGVLIGGQN